MREIKFRMWNSCGINSRFLYSFQALECMNQQQLKIYDHEKDGCFFEQFTGFYDQNERDIYEGDIVKWINAPGMIAGNAIVFFNTMCGTWYIKNDSYNVYDDLYNVTGYCEVIGNIHENPGLLD